MKKILLTLLFVFITGVSFAQVLNNIEINMPNYVKQGQHFFIYINTDKSLKNPFFVFKGKKIPLFQISENKYRGMYGIEALDKTGKEKIVFGDDNSFLNSFSKVINIINEKYPIQNLIVSKKQTGLEPTSNEIIKINNAKNVLSDDKLWGTLPFDSPTKGCIASQYGLTRYYNGKPSGNYHKGIDIKAPLGQKINAVTSGKVLIAEQFKLNGGTVAIDHGQGLLSFYLHMNKIYVKEGDKVIQNQPIGEVGSTGFSTGPHLHWGLYINGNPIDPMQFWVKKVPKC